MGDVVGMGCKDTLMRESVGCPFIVVLALGLPVFDAVFVSGVSDVMVTWMRHVIWGARYLIDREV